MADCVYFYTKVLTIVVTQQQMDSDCDTAAVTIQPEVTARCCPDTRQSVCPG